MMHISVALVFALAAAPALSEKSSPSEWIDVTASASRDIGRAVVGTENGDVISAGGFSTHLGGEARQHRLFNRGSYDIFVTRHDATGTRQWLRAIGGPGKSSASQLALDAKGDVCLAGSFTESVGGVRDKMPELISHGASDGLVSCFDQSGNIIWAKRFGGKKADSLNGILATADNGWIVSGDYSGTVVLDLADQESPEVLTSKGTRSGWLLGLNEQGENQWVTTFQSTGEVSVRSVAKSQQGDLLALLRFTGELEITNEVETQTYESTRLSDLLVVALTSNGQAKWSKSITGPGAEDGAALAVNASGQIAVAGSFVDTLQMGEATIQSQGSSDSFVAVMSMDGELVALRRFGADQSEMVYDMISVTDDWLLATTFIDHTTYGNEQFNATATSTLLVRLDADGEFSHATLIDGLGLEQVTKLAGLPCGRVAAVGQFNGTLQHSSSEQSFQPMGKLDAFAGSLLMPGAAVVRNCLSPDVQVAQLAPGIVSETAHQIILNQVRR